MNEVSKLLCFVDTANHKSLPPPEWDAVRLEYWRAGVAHYRRIVWLERQRIKKIIRRNGNFQEILKKSESPEN